MAPKRLAPGLLDLDTDGCRFLAVGLNSAKARDDEWALTIDSRPQSETRCLSCGTDGRNGFGALAPRGD